VPTRRTVIQSAAALSAAPLAPGFVFAGSAGDAAGINVFYDHRHAEARAFRLRAAQWDVPIAGTLDGDITDFWQNYLSVAWQKKPVTLVGMTERPALFMFEQLGWQHGLRVVFQGEHEALETGRWTHRIARASSPGIRRELDAGGSMWPAVLADRMLGASHQIVSQDRTPSGAAMAAYHGEPTKLYSWIIAPRTAA